MDTDSRISEIIAQEQFHLTQQDKELMLLPIIKEQVRLQMQHPRMKRFYEANNFSLEKCASVESIPPLPVTMFKNFDLSLCKPEEIVRVLKSSGTTGQQSIITIDKITAFRQIASLISILKHYLGKKRRPFLVLDSAESNADRDSISARGAAIRGLSNFSSDTCYAFDGTSNELKLNRARVEAFLEKHREDDVLAFGFTFIIWSQLLPALANKPLHKTSSMILLHSGGWKKLTEQQVSKSEFNKAASKALQTMPENVLDFYGMAEQTGIVFIDCSAGNKHVPDFADVIIRNPLTMAPCDLGEPGLIEVVSSLAHSYPGQALLTEDIGQLETIDDCSCGRKGKAFRFLNRVEKAEIRGCGDTFTPKVHA